MLPVAHVKLLRKAEQAGGYVTMVFEDIDKPNSPDRYIMCTLLPNWNELIKIREGDTGYLKYKEVSAGEDTWYDQGTKGYIPYNWDAVYFDTFIDDKPAPVRVCLD